MTELGQSQLRRTGVSLLTKRLMSVIAFVMAMAVGLSLGYLAVQVLTTLTTG